MGYYNYQNGLIYNHLNQEGGWDDHLRHCRDIIIRMLDYFRPSRVTVLGSGWLLDVPLAEMVEQHREVYLVDIIHPPEVIRQAGELRNVNLVEQDITGGLIGGVWDLTVHLPFFRKLKTLDPISVPDYETGFDPGFVISLNILTQLESQIMSWLRKKVSPGEDAFTGFRKKIQEKHIDFLRKHSSLLISDYEEVVTGRRGETSASPTLLADVPRGLFREEWMWDFDLKGRENYNSRITIKELSIAWG